MKIPGSRADIPVYLVVEQRYLCKVAESQDSLESRYMERQLPLSLWWLCLWFPRFLISLSIVSDPLMRLSIQTLMSGMEHQQGAEKRWSFNKHFYENLPPPEMLSFFCNPFYESPLFLEQKENGAFRAVVQISGDRLGHTVTVSDLPTLYVCRGKSPRGVCAKPTLSRDLSSMIEKIAFPTLCACPGESARCSTISRRLKN